MKKLVAALMTATLLLTFTGCGDHSHTETTTEATSTAGVNAEADQVIEENSTIKVQSLNGNDEMVEVEVPFAPQRIAVVDMAMLDIIDSLGLGDRVVGSSQTKLDYLQKYTTTDGIKNLGSIKEADMEAVMECEPELILMGGRMSEYYDKLVEIAPVVRLTIEDGVGTLEGTKKNAHAVAAIFGKEAEVDAMFTDYEARIEKLKEVANGQDALVGLCTSGSFNVIGDNGRCSIIGNEIGFENVGNAAAEEAAKEKEQGNSSAHGNEASFELIADLNPAYIFVLDRDAAIGTNGAQLAKDIMENELVMGTDAYKNGNLVIFENPAVWYTAEGGVTALGTMLADVESALLK